MVLLSSKRIPSLIDNFPVDTDHWFTFFGEAAEVIDFFRECRVGHVVLDEPGQASGKTSHTSQSTRSGSMIGAQSFPVWWKDCCAMRFSIRENVVASPVCGSCEGDAGAARAGLVDRSP